MPCQLRRHRMRRSPSVLPTDRKIQTTNGEISVDKILGCDKSCSATYYFPDVKSGGNHKGYVWRPAMPSRNFGEYLSSPYHSCSRRCPMQVVRDASGASWASSEGWLSGLTPILPLFAAEHAEAKKIGQARNGRPADRCQESPLFLRIVFLAQVAAVESRWPLGRIAKTNS